MILELVAAASVAKDVHFELPSSGYRFDAAEGGVASDQATQETRFVLTGHAVAASKDMTFRAETVKGLFVTPKGAKRSVLKHAETTGPGSVTRSVQRGHETETTVLDGTRFVFDGDAAVGHLRIAGPVQITDSGSGKSNLRMTGDSGTAQFDMQQQPGQDALRGATLDGRVAADIVAFGKNAGSIHATGDRLILDDAVQPHTLVLTGHVSIQGKGQTGVGSVSGIQKVKFLLNRQGQFTHVSAGETPN